MSGNTGKETEQHEGVTTAFPVESIAAQLHAKTGSEASMEPKAVMDQVEDFDEHGKPFLRPYRGSNKLQNKVALITGGDSGIGRSVAILYAHEGADVSIVYLPHEREDAESLQVKFKQLGRRLNCIEADLLDEANWKAVVDKHLAAFDGRIDILVNNASRQHIETDIENIDLENTKKTFLLNNVAMIALVKYSVPHMKRGARIIQSTSVTSHAGSAKLIDYSSTKGAIHTMTRSLAAQLAPRGIRVNCVAPGIIWTPLQPATDNQAAETMEELGKNAIPLQRCGQPVEVAVAYVFLASAEASYFTGSCLEPDGGKAMST